MATGQNDPDSIGRQSSKQRRLSYRRYISDIFAAALSRATERNVLLLLREIQKGIRSQAPGGSAFAPLPASTVKRKGSSKALIDVLKSGNLGSLDGHPEF